MILARRLVSRTSELQQFPFEIGVPVNPADVGLATGLRIQPTSVIQLRRAHLPSRNDSLASSR